MVRLVSAAALLLAGVASAVLVPTGLAPGMYAIPFDDNGDALTAPIALGDIALEKRQQNGVGTLPQGQVTCGTNGNLNIAVWTTAKEAFQSMCDSHPDLYPANMVVIYTSGNTVAYMCNFNNANRCWRSEYQNAMDQIVARCGSGRGGEVYVSQYGKTYGADNIPANGDLHICGH